MIISPVRVTFSRHELEAVHRVIELAIASRATGKVRRRSLEGAMESIELGIKLALKAKKEEPA
jgi:hypothetical protein